MNHTETPARWTTTDIPDLSGRTVVVTGANSGLGYETTRALAAHGARVVLAVRSAAKGEAARDRIHAEHPKADLELRPLDLADLDSVRTCAEALLAAHPRIDVLVNNAGIMFPPRELTPQGFESQFGGNHLGHFALTGLLLPALKAAGRADGSADARVVTVSSGLHRSGSIHFDDLTGERSYSPSAFYSQSKFANVVFALELDRRLRTADLPVLSLLAHPGYAATNLQTTGPTGVTKFVARIGNVLFAQSAERGALSQLYAATAPGVRGGEFYGPGGPGEMRGHPKRVKPVAGATDAGLGARLWQVSEDLTDLHYPF